MNYALSLILAVTGPMLLVFALIGMVTIYRTSHTPPAPDFGCVQTISADDAHRIASDLHVYSSEGDSVRFYFECQDRFTVIRLGRAR